MDVSARLRNESPSGRLARLANPHDGPAAVTLRDLIATRVRGEVARYKAGPTSGCEGLGMPAGAQPSPQGFLMPRPRRVEGERQADEAIESFGRKGFFVLLDDREVTELAAELELTVDSDIRFVRLARLIGG